MRDLRLDPVLLSHVNAPPDDEPYTEAQLSAGRRLSIDCYASTFPNLSNAGRMRAASPTATICARSAARYFCATA